MTPYALRSRFVRVHPDVYVPAGTALSAGLRGAGRDVHVGMDPDEPAPQRVRGHQAERDGLASDERLRHGRSVPGNPDKRAERALAA
ncbi:hypothetical protein MAHJHV28_45790 [Mycobacterium avium subsp. hominissuis]